MNGGHSDTNCNRRDSMEGRDDGDPVHTTPLADDNKGQGYNCDLGRPELEAEKLPPRPPIAAKPPPCPVRMRHFYNSNRSRRNMRNIDEEFNSLHLGEPSDRARDNTVYTPTSEAYQPGFYSSQVTTASIPQQAAHFYPQQIPINSAPFLPSVPYPTVPMYWVNGSGGLQYVVLAPSTHQMCTLMPEGFVRSSQMTTPIQSSAESVEPFHFIPVISEVSNPMFEQQLWLAHAGGPVNPVFPLEPEAIQSHVSYGAAELTRRDSAAQQQSFNAGCATFHSTDPQLCPNEQMTEPGVAYIYTDETPPKCIQQQPQTASKETGVSAAGDYHNVGDRSDCFQQPRESAFAGNTQRLFREQIDAAVQWRNGQVNESAVQTQDDRHRQSDDKYYRQPRESGESYQMSGQEDLDSGGFGVVSPVYRSWEKSPSSSEVDFINEKDANSSPSSLMLQAADSRTISPWSSNTSTNDSLNYCPAATTNRDTNRNSWTDKHLYSRVFYNRAKRWTASPCQSLQQGSSKQRRGQGRRRFSYDNPPPPNRRNDGRAASEIPDQFNRLPHAAPGGRSRRGGSVARFNL